MELVEKFAQFNTATKLKLSSERIGIFLEFCRVVVSGIIIYLDLLVKWLLPRKRKSLDGDVILITGSAGGLGQEICKQLAASGAKLVLWDVSSEANKETAESLRKLGAQYVLEDTVDVSDRDQIVQAAKKVRDTFGHVTILVNNAGIATVNQFLDLKPTAVRKTFEVNVLSQFWTIQEFLPDMMERKRGHIVTIASTMSFMTMRGSASYFASKHSVHGLVECLKDELADKGCKVKFTTCYPFFINTNLTEGSGLKLSFKFPSLTPFLEVKYVAEQIIEGIRCEKEFIYLPRTFHFYLFLKPFLPTRFHQALINFFVQDYHIPAAVAPQKQAMAEDDKHVLNVNNNETDKELLENSVAQDGLVKRKNGSDKSFMDHIQKIPVSVEKIE